MKITIYALIPIIIFSVNSSIYAHSGRTNSSGCHNDTKTGGYHCHGKSSGNSGGGSTSINRYETSDSELFREGTYIVFGAIIIVSVISWGYMTNWGKKSTGCGCLASSNIYYQNQNIGLLNKVPYQITENVNINLNRHVFGEWRLGPSYTFRF